MNVQIMTLRNVQDIVTELVRIGAPEAHLEHMSARGLHRCVRIWGAGGLAARELHDAMLAAGGSAALPDNPCPASCDLLLFGTYDNFRRMAAYLPENDPCLAQCAEQINDAILYPESDPAPITCRGFTLLWGQRTHVMGILNTTPDSFFAGSRKPGFSDAVESARAMILAGADIIDIGGESTRPGADPVPEDVERERTAPVIEAIRKEFPDILISIDTYKSAIAAAALDAGADIINDISALRMDKALAKVAARANCPVCLMHMQGEPRNMQKEPRYDKDVVGEIIAFLEERMDAALDAGISEDNIILDPGIGFGKTVEHNLEIMSRLDEFRALGRPVLLGASRKRFIGAVLGLPDEARRLEGSLAVAALGAAKHADIIRVHDVPETVKAVRMADAIVRKKRTLEKRGQ
jgi:dihydropteroate synthase